MDVIVQEQIQEQTEEGIRSPAPGMRMSYEEFLEWCDEDTWAEWVDGEVILLSPASTRHQRIKKFLADILGLHCHARGLGEVLDAPFLMKLERGREPDVLFVAREHLDRLKENYLDGPADLVVEIVSPDSVERDRGTKFVEYEAAGVREYWLIDPLRERAEFYQLDEEGFYRPVPDLEGMYRSQAVSGFWLKVEWLWRESLPSPVRVVAEIAGVDPALTEAFERALRGAE
jgi:Uma2 family endonuclease